MTSARRLRARSDFGIAYAAERLQTTTRSQWCSSTWRPSRRWRRVDRRTDARRCRAWEALTGQRCSKGQRRVHGFAVQAGVCTAPSEIVEEPRGRCSRARAPSLGAATARRRLDLPATWRARFPAPTEAARWVAETADESLAKRRARVRIESSETGDTGCRARRPGNPTAQSSLSSRHGGGCIRWSALAADPEPAPPPAKGCARCWSRRWLPQSTAP
jgi:hypothetical protein